MLPVSGRPSFNPKKKEKKKHVLNSPRALQTTTSERMLFYSGAIRYLGNVDDGNTQLDHLAEERARGITIVAAATNFAWAGHTVNLIDTPGHVDFTLEVERALRVLDGAVVIFDGVAGVQTQTLTVFRQARKFNIPVVGFVNKLDRDGASFDKAVATVRDKLAVTPIPIHVPVGEAKAFAGVVDLVTLQQFTWNDSTCPAGDKFTTVSLDATRLPADLIARRAALVETLADLDDTLAELVLSVDDYDFAATPPADVQAALRRVTLAGTGMPVLCGSARRNKGIQPLLDAVPRYLPSPFDRPPVRLALQGGGADAGGGHKTKSTELALAADPGGPLCALAFKVVFHPQRGPLVFVRVYSGRLSARSTLLNPNKRAKERVTRLLRVHADHFTEVTEAMAGDIVALVGLKDTATGDTLVDAADKNMRTARLVGVDIPPPVFACSIEGDSAATQVLGVQNDERA
jgi:elongation factor G